MSSLDYLMTIINDEDMISHILVNLLWLNETMWIMTQAVQEIEMLWMMMKSFIMLLINNEFNLVKAFLMMSRVLMKVMMTQFQMIIWDRSSCLMNIIMLWLFAQFWWTYWFRIKQHYNNVYIRSCSRDLRDVTFCLNC